MVAGVDTTIFSYVINKITLTTLLLHVLLRMANGDSYDCKCRYSTIESGHGTVSTVKSIGQ